VRSPTRRKAPSEVVAAAAAAVTEERVLRSKHLKKRHNQRHLRNQQPQQRPSHRRHPLGVVVVRADKLGETMTEGAQTRVSTVAVIWLFFSHSLFC
jgi:hypothetical protein